MLHRHQNYCIAGNFSSELETGTQLILATSQQPVPDPMATETTPITQESTTCSSPIPQDPSTEEQAGKKPSTCPPLGPALGGVAASLAAILVGVVLGWVWHCHRNKDRAKFHER